jgi:micrococcal nuclease
LSKLFHPREWIASERVPVALLDDFCFNTGERVRLIGVNTPESVRLNTPVQRFSKEAADFTRRMVEGKRVRPEYDQANAARGHKDNTQQKRTLAYVFLEDGTLPSTNVSPSTTR